jgi:hypothetical protein
MNDMKPNAAYKLDKVLALVKVLADDNEANREYELDLLAEKWLPNELLDTPWFDIISRLARHALDSMEE